MKCSLARFIYLNTYGFLLIGGGLVLIALPFWLLTLWTLIPQCMAGAFFMYLGIKLISNWKNKKRQYELLMKRNSKEFRPETFEIYMKAPCGRKLTHVVLKDLNKSNEYKNLLVYKPGFIESVLSLCEPEPDPKTSVNGQVLKTYVNPKLKG